MLKNFITVIFFNQTIEVEGNGAKSLWTNIS